MPEPKTVSTQVGVAEGHLYNGAFAANVGMKIMDGKYGDALVATGTKVALTPGTYHALAEVTKDAAQISSALKGVTRFIPGLSAAVSAYYVVQEVAGDIKDGNYKKATVAAVAGAVEIGVNSVSGVGGTIARQLIVEGAARIGGEEYRANDAALVQLGKAAYEKGSKFLAEHNAHHEQETVAKNEEKSTPAAKPVKRQPAMGLT